MESVILDGKITAKRVKQSVAVDARAFLEKYHRKPSLTVIHAGDDAGSAVYVRNKQKACEKVGIDFTLLRKPDTTTFEEIREAVHQCNTDEHCDGMLVQLPLPGNIDETPLLHMIRPDKDVDGFHPENIGRMWEGTGHIAPCTPAGIMELLDSYAIEITGKNALIIGRSNIVGKPMAALLLERHATVTIAHSRTRDLPDLCRNADILVAAVGRPGFVTPAMIKPGAVVIDVGINRITRDQAQPHWLNTETRIGRKLQEKGSTLVGDVDPIGIGKIASFYTPVPGGVGPMTIAMLLKTTVRLGTLRMETSL